MQDDRFGEGKKPIRFLLDACKQITKPLCNTDVKIVLRDLYEEYYGIYPHISKHNKSRPLASVAMHPCENKTDNSLLEEALNNYVKANIFEFFGLNWNEFISQPREVNELMLKIADKKMSEKTNSAEDVENKLRREMAHIQGNKKVMPYKRRR